MVVEGLARASAGLPADQASALGASMAVPIVGRLKSLAEQPRGISAVHTLDPTCCMQAAVHLIVFFQAAHFAA